MREPERPDPALKAFMQGLEALRHFRTQMSMLGNAGTLQLFSTVGPDPFTNEDARSVFLVKRQASWKRLSQLTEAGLIQKRGHSYRVAPFTREFVESLASLTVALLIGNEVVPVPPSSKLSLEVALEGLEILYAKGRLSQEEYARHRTELEEMIGAVSPEKNRRV